MNSSVSSSESSGDDTGVLDFKAAQAAQFSKLNGTANPLKFKEAQAMGFRTDSIYQMPPKKPRSSSIDQTAPTRTRSTTQRQTQTPTSAAPLHQLFATDNKETKETRQLLHTALAQLDASSRRLAHSDAERRALESSQLAQTTQTLLSASVVQQNAAAAQAQLTLYELQLEAAKAEIERAQGLVRALEAQRDDAEDKAARARTLARKLHVENRAYVAREEGRKEGYEMGFGHGQMIAAAKEQRRHERLEAEMRRRQIQIAPLVSSDPYTREPRSAFIEEHFSEGENGNGNEGRRNTNATRTVSRAVSDARRAPPAQQETRRRRETLDSVRSVQQQQPQQRPPEPPPLAAPPPAAPASPVAAPSNFVNDQPPPPQPQPQPQPQSQRPPSVASSRRVSAPPVAPSQQQQQQQAPRPRITSIDFGAPQPRPRAMSIDSRAGAGSARAPPRAGAVEPAVNGNATHANANGNGNRSLSGAGSQHTRRNSTASRNSAAAATATAQPHRRTSSAASASASRLNLVDDEALGLGRPPPPMPMEGMIRNIPMPPPPVPVMVTMPEPIVMPQHVPMPPPPPGAGGVPVSMGAPPVQPPITQQQQQFEVERPGPSGERRETRPQSPSSATTSLRTLHLTSFPTVIGSAAGSERDFPTGAGPGMGGMGGGGGMGVGRDRERNLSTIIEHATGESQQHGNGNVNGGGWDAVRQQQQTPWTRRSSPYSDPRGMEEWRRETDEEAVRPPPSPVTSPGMLSPYDPIRPPTQNQNPNTNVQQRPSQESFQSDLRRSSSGSSSHTVNITIVPPSRPTSVGNSAGLPTEGGSGRFLSPNHQPVVPEEDEEEEEEEEEDDSDDDTNFHQRVGPLPAFAQGVSTLPPGFIPTSVAPAAGNAQTPMGAGSSWGAPPPVPAPVPAEQPASRQWYVPPVIGANSVATEPVHPPSRQGMPGPGPGNPPNANANAPATWTAPPVMAVAPTYPTTSRPTGGVLGNPANAARAAPPLTVEPVARPPSRQMMGSIIGNPASGAFTVEPVRPPSRLGLGNPASGFTVEPVVRPSSRLGNYASGFTVEPVVRPSSRLGNHASGFTAEPVVRPSSRLGNPASGFTVEPVVRPSSRLGNPASRFTTEPAQPPIPQMGGIYGPPASGLMAGPARPPSRQMNPASGFVVEPARPSSRQGGGVPAHPGNAAWGAPPVMGGNPMGPPQQPSGHPGQMAGAPGGNWSMAGQYAFGQSSTPGNQPPQPLGFPVPPMGGAGIVPYSPLPTHPQSFVGVDNPPLRSTTPRPIYGPPAANPLYGPPAANPLYGPPSANAPSGTGYGAPTPGVAAGYPLPASRSNSTATTTPYQRIANLNAGTTPAAAFNSRALSRPTSRASSGGFTRYNNNQTPHPDANLGITNPYTSIQEESPGSDSSRSSLGLARMSSFDRMTANNTLANANASYAGAPVIPPSPANSYRPM